MDEVILHRVVLKLRYLGAVRDRDLVQAVQAMHHKSMLCAKLAKRLGQRPGQGGVIDAHDLGGHLCRVRERPEDVEDSANADLPPRPDGVLHGQVHHGREQKADAYVLDTFLGAMRGYFDVHTQRLQHVGAAAFARNRAVAVLRHGYSRAGHHECNGSRYVKRMGHVAAGAAGVNLIARVEPDRHRLLAHDPGGTRDLLHGLALHAKRGDIRGDLGVSCLALHDLAHYRFGFQFSKIGFCNDFPDGFFDHKTSQPDTDQHGKIGLRPFVI